MFQAVINEPIGIPIETVSVSNQDDAMATIVLAFSTDPVVRWMYPEPQQYLTYFPQFIMAFGGRAIDTGTAYYVSHYAGIALWFPPGVESDEEALMAIIEQSIPESHQSTIFALIEEMGNYHPEEPHWYLPVIGVEPAQRNKGYGSALMEQVLSECDRDRLPAYLESSNPDNLRFYQRHGFEQLGTIQVGESPPIFPMLRHPQ